MAKKKKTDSPTKKGFEENLKQLEEIVEGLESGELPLEQSIQNYEAGMIALKECYATLNDAEKKIETITRGKSGSKRKKVDLVDTDGDLLAADDPDDEETLLF